MPEQLDVITGTILTFQVGAMRIAIFADIHGNILALEAVLTDLQSRRVDKFVNLGDCVSGPLWPRETAELLMRLSWPTVRGNHDRWVTDWPPDQQYRSRPVLSASSCSLRAESGPESWRGMGAFFPRSAQTFFASDNHISR
jgi:Calcineurin-like phosphoesterase